MRKAVFNILAQLGSLFKYSQVESQTPGVGSVSKISETLFFEAFVAFVEKKGPILESFWYQHIRIMLSSNRRS